MASKKTFLNVMSLAVLTACNGGALPSLGEDPSTTEQETEQGEDVIEDEAPEDTTGGNGSVEVRFASSSGLSLDGAADVEVVGEAPAMVISESLTVSMARFNVKSLKLKSKKDASDLEYEHEKKECDEDDAALEALEVPTVASLDADEKESDDDEETDKKDDGQGDRDEKDNVTAEGHRKNLAKDREKHANDERDQDDREHGRDLSTRFLGLIYDAVKGAFEGVAPKVDIADGSYRRVEFKLRRNMSLPESDPLLGNVFVIQGTVKIGEQAVPFEIEHHSAMNFRIRGDKAFAVVAGDDNPLTVVFDVEKWFEGIDLSSGTVGEDGVIHISHKINRDILKQLRRNIKHATRFGKDLNKDGKLGDDEVVAAGAEATEDDERN